MVSSTGGSSSLALTGLISGFDTATMIQTLLSAQRAAIGAKQTAVTTRQSQVTAVKDVNTRLNALLTTVKKFADASYTQSKFGTVSPAGTNPTVSVSAGASAAVGTFKVTVNQLADATRVSSPSAIGQAINSAALLKDTNLGLSISAGFFTINGTQITVDPTTDTLDAVMQRIRDNVAGSTVSLVADSSGRNNLLQIAHASGVTLGAGGDTSNFLGATRLISSPGTTTRTSTGNLGVTQTGALLASASLVTPIAPSSGSFKVNGVSITYDGAQDSISTVLSRINSSSAGVNAVWDAATDKVTFTNRTTGSTAIALQDVAGNFLAAIGVNGATQTLGKNAQVQVDAGAGNVTYYSTTNTVTDAVPGVTISLLKESASADTVSVSQDSNGVLSKVRELVNMYNSAVDFIAKQTAFDEVNGNGTLAGDSSINGIAGTLRSIITSKIDGVSTGKRTLADLGLTFGAFGSKVGTTNTLTFDETKFKAALEADPSGVSTVFSAFRATASLNGAGTGPGSLASITGDPTAPRTPGKYNVTSELNGDGTAKITATFFPTGGGTQVTTVLNSVTAGSSTTNLLPGLNVTFKGTLVNGTDQITVNTPVRGIQAKLEQYLDPLARAGGVLDLRKESGDKSVQSMKDNITKMNTRLSEERLRLQDKFAKMEVALAKLKEQQSSLTALNAAIGSGY